MGRVSVMVDAEGRLVLPVEIRQSLGLEGGGELVLEVADHELRGSTRKGALARLREVVPPWQPGEPLWSEQLIAERRAEAARDLAEEEADRARRVAGR